MKRKKRPATMGTIITTITMTENSIIVMKRGMDITTITTITMMRERLKNTASAHLYITADRHSTSISSTIS